MAFDPTLPQTNAPIASAELRDQFTGLKEIFRLRPGQVSVKISTRVGLLQQIAFPERPARRASAEDAGASIWAGRWCFYRRRGCPHVLPALPEGAAVAGHGCAGLAGAELGRVTKAL